MAYSVHLQQESFYFARRLLESRFQSTESNFITIGKIENGCIGEYLRETKKRDQRRNRQILDILVYLYIWHWYDDMFKAIYLFFTVTARRRISLVIKYFRLEKSITLTLSLYRMYFRIKRESRTSVWIRKRGRMNSIVLLSNGRRILFASLTSMIQIGSSELGSRQPVLTYPS